MPFFHVLPNQSAAAASCASSQGQSWSLLRCRVGASENDGLAESCMIALAGVVSTNPRFVNFNIARKFVLAGRFHHVLANLLTDTVSALVGYAKLPLKLFA
jgi:hypothetical protein